jgi:hypothetical protein
MKFLFLPNHTTRRRRLAWMQKTDHLGSRILLPSVHGKTLAADLVA